MKFSCRVYTLFLFICLMWYMYVPAGYAQVKQVGRVTLQNSGNKPLANVQVRAIGAIPTGSDSGGRFTLQYNKARKGQLLLLDQVYKAGYELVNERALSQWVLSSSHILPIVMCPVGSLVAAQEKYYNIGYNYNMSRYNEACNKLKKQLRKNAISVAQYNKLLDSLSLSLQKTCDKKSYK